MSTFITSDYIPDSTFQGGRGAYGSILISKQSIPGVKIKSTQDKWFALIFQLFPQGFVPYRFFRDRWERSRSWPLYLSEERLSPLSLGWISNDVNYFTETGSSIALQNPGVVVETLWVGFFSVQFYQNVTPSFISMWLEILWQTIQEDRAWP